LSWASLTLMPPNLARQRETVSVLTPTRRASSVSDLPPDFRTTFDPQI
jgi:hypothetical protein